MSRRRRWILRTLFVALFVFIALLSAELVARRFIPPFDLAPIRLIAATMRVEPGGKLTEPDEVLGYRNSAGAFRMFFDGRQWDVSHDKDGTRPTRERIDQPDARPAIWIFGCSLTHGFGVNDDQTYAWLLQNQLADWQVVNFGADGYSNLQAFLQFKQAIQHQPAPRCVVLAYAGFHDIRNTVSREWRLHLSLANSSYGVTQLPYGSLDASGVLTTGMKPLTFTPLPFTRFSSLISLAEFASWQYDATRLRSVEVTQQLIRDFHDEVRRSGSQFLIAIVRSPGWMPEFCRQEGISCVDVAPDRSGRVDLFWDDGHPKPEGHQRIARDLLLALRGWRLNVSAGCDASASPDRPIQHGHEPTWTIRTTQTDGKPWSVQWMRTIPVSMGDGIVLKFMARASNPLKTEIKPMAAGSPTEIGATSSLDIGKDWATHEARFESRHQGDADIVWQLGAQVGKFEIRDLEITRNGDPISLPTLLSSAY